MPPVCELPPALLEESPPVAPPRPVVWVPPAPAPPAREVDESPPAAEELPPAPLVEVPPDPADELPPCELAVPPALAPPDPVPGVDEEEQDIETTAIPRRAMARIECFIGNSGWVFFHCHGPARTAEWANRT